MRLRDIESHMKSDGMVWLDSYLDQMGRTQWAVYEDGECVKRGMLARDASRLLIHIKKQRARETWNQIKILIKKGFKVTLVLAVLLCGMRGGFAGEPLERRKSTEQPRQTVTFYCACRTCCGEWSGGPTASGTMPKAGRTIAAPSHVPFGTWVWVEGIGARRVEDRTADGLGWDVYVSTHAKAKRFGVRTLAIITR